MAKRDAMVLLLVPVLACANLGGLTGGDASTDDAPRPEASPRVDGHAPHDAARDGAAGCKVDCDAAREASPSDARTMKEAEADAGVADAHVVPDTAPDVAAPTCESGASCSAEKACAPATCEDETCLAGCCVVKPAAVGASCTADGGAYCDGTGACVACLTDMECPPIATVCMKPLCTQNHCLARFAPAGTACTTSVGGKVCNATGACVECTTTSTSACTGTTPYCAPSGTCVQCLTNAQCTLLQSCTNDVCVGL